MQPDPSFKAVVKNRRLVIGEVVDEPDGTEHELAMRSNDEDDLDDAERAALHASLDAAYESLKAGKARPIEDVLRELDKL